MMQIHNLTKKQVKILDHLWYVIQTPDEFEEWIEELNEEDRNTAILMLQILQMEMAEDDLQKQEEFPEVENLLKNLAKS